MTSNNIAPIAAIIVFAAVLIGIAYANVTGMLAVSGAELIDSTTATIIVAVLFIATLPWVYKQTKST
ncbi:hypothetical protein [Salinigranum halophilum]|uniref:hypothetical protein n=1 Tax=Salinigranum halophilum TaxID=2565931 RepID=UPI0010A8DFF0|nr:hypothetical protein [Salinigranum halophilum]